MSAVSTAVTGSGQCSSDCQRSAQQWLATVSAVVTAAVSAEVTVSDQHSSDYFFQNILWLHWLYWCTPSNKWFSVTCDYGTIFTIFGNYTISSFSLLRELWYQHVSMHCTNFMGDWMSLINSKPCSADKCNTVPCLDQCLLWVARVSYLKIL